MKHPKCSRDDAHSSHTFLINEGDGEVLISQLFCDGVPRPAPEPPPLHGHGDGPHPDSCPQCYVEYGH